MFALRSEGQIGKARMLARQGPSGLAVPGDINDGKLVVVHGWALAAPSAGGGLGTEKNRKWFEFRGAHLVKKPFICQEPRRGHFVGRPQQATTNCDRTGDSGQVKHEQYGRSLASRCTPGRLLECKIFVAQSHQ